MCLCMPKPSDAVTDVQFNTSRSHLNMHECSGQELFGYKELQPVPQGEGAVFFSSHGAQDRSVACSLVALDASAGEWQTHDIQRHTQGDHRTGIQGTTAASTSHKTSTWIHQESARWILHIIALGS
jgi:hypothetical protein